MLALQSFSKCVNLYASSASYTMAIEIILPVILETTVLRSIAIDYSYIKNIVECIAFQDCSRDESRSKTMKYDR